MSHPSKAKGYRGEIIARDLLRAVFPWLERTGSIAYHLDAADLVQKPAYDGGDPPIRVITTHDDRGPVLVTMSVEDLVRVASQQDGQWYGAVVVQCKKHRRTWIGGLYAALREATR